MAVTPPSSGASRTVPRNRQHPPISGALTSASNAAGLIGSRVRWFMSSAGEGRQEGHFIALNDLFIESDLAEIQRGQWSFGKVYGSWERLPHMPNNVRDGSRQREIHCRLLP